MIKQENETKLEAFEDDKLNRKFLAENLKTILLNTTSKVFALNAPWGGGKSYFIENLEKLIADNAICISYNAWESDFYNNPFVPLITEMILKIEQEIGKEDTLHKEVNAIKTKARELAEKTSFQASINLGLFTIGGEFDPDKPTLESDYIALKTLKDDFKKKLALIQEKLNKNIIIFIDDLDRCNPKYAIETLEAIKHFFGIKNIIFVLAVDKKQIENTVRTMYGICENTSDIDGYLRKFIDVEINLPDPSYKDFIEFHLSLIDEQIEKFKKGQRYYNYGELTPCIEIDTRRYNRDLVSTINCIVDDLKFNPRAIEKLFLRVKLTIEALNDNDILLIEPIFILNALYICNKEDFNTYIDLPNNVTLQNSNAIKIVQTFSYWKEILKNFEKIIETYHRTERIAANSNMLNAVQIQKFIQGKGINIVKYLKDYPAKIEFIGNFE